MTTQQLRRRRKSRSAKRDGDRNKQRKKEYTDVTNGLKQKKKKKNDDGKEPHHPSPSLTPLSFLAIFVVLWVPRLAAAIWAPVADCDETFNYWEPTHFTIFGFGMQTWEYSPVYALRTYSYLLPHAVAARLATLLAQGDKPRAFLLTRAAMATVSALCDAALCYQVSQPLVGKELEGEEEYQEDDKINNGYDHGQDSLGPLVGRYLLFFLALAPGPSVSSAVAFVPSAAGGWFASLSLATWIFARRQQQGRGEETNEGDVLSFVSAQASVLLAWPFSALAFAPLLPDFLVRRGLGWFLHWGLLTSCLLLLLSSAVDAIFYHRVLFASLNIVLYNVLGGAGPDLYGTESWTFFLKNGVLNFGVAFPLALLALPLLSLQSFGRYLSTSSSSSASSSIKQVILSLWNASVPLLGFYTSFLLLSKVSHKEERFLFPAYSGLCLSAAVALRVIGDMVGEGGRVVMTTWVGRGDSTTADSARWKERISRVVTWPLLFVFVLFSLVRTEMIGRKLFDDSIRVSIGDRSSSLTFYLCRFLVSSFLFLFLPFSFPFFLSLSLSSFLFLFLPFSFSFFLSISLSQSPSHTQTLSFISLSCH